MYDVAVHGLGYVGLTAAVHWALKGTRVVGFDPDDRVVAGILSGAPRAGEMLSYLDVDVARLVSDGLLTATSRREDILNVRAHVLAVPTERAGEPYDGIVEETILWLADHLLPRSLIVVESTLTPGTTDRLLPRLRRKVGEDLFLAVCPRRDWFADASKNLATLPRVVGGVTSTCTARAVELLRLVSARILTTDYRTAEITKALENALLHVPVMFAHQLAVALPDRNIAEALELAGTHWRLTPLFLNFGTGGRCVPLGTRYLVAAAGDKLGIGRAAIDWDAKMRRLVADVVVRRGARRACVLGIAYRPNFRDAGLSPGLDVAVHLREARVDVRVADPVWQPAELERMTGFPTSSDTVDCDAVLLATPHEAFLGYPLEPGRWREGQLVLDAQGAWKMHRERFHGYRVDYRRVGDPGWMEA